MSFALGVWYPQKRIHNDEAGQLYVRLCDGDASGLAPHPAIDAFYAELTTIHPEIDTIPEDKLDGHDYCPWSCKLDHSSTYVLMSCVWSKQPTSINWSRIWPANTASPFTTLRTGK